MNERARQCGGELDCVSRPGKGTTVIARLPLQADDSDIDIQYNFDLGSPNSA
jgi:signal transduction histidine kinase